MEKIESAAEEIAHDVVEPPEDDAPPATVSIVMRRVARAFDAAKAALLEGRSVEEARSDASFSAKWCR